MAIFIFTILIFFRVFNLYNINSKINVTYISLRNQLLTLDISDSKFQLILLETMTRFKSNRTSCKYELYSICYTSTCIMSDCCELVRYTNKFLKTNTNPIEYSSTEYEVL